MPRTWMCNVCQHLEESIIYEFTINECQKKDWKYSSILDSIRCGSPSEDAIATLHERVIDVTITEKFGDMQSLKMSPV